MATRSIYRVLGQLAVSVQVPDVHLVEGRAPPLGGDLTEERPHFTVYSGCTKPKECFTATCYRGHWFWIDDRDAESKRVMNLYQVAEEISRRLANIFLKDKDCRRPVYGGTRKFQEDAHWRDCLQFF